MRSITRLFSALGTLADSLLALAGVVNIATDKLRHQLAIEAVEVIEHQPASDEASTAHPPCAVETATSRRGRKSS
jgi:hypothetical protein